MSMNAKDIKDIARYVEGRPGCSREDIQAKCPNVTNLDSLLDEASEGARQGEGCILRQENGLFYPGPSIDIVLKSIS